MCRGWRALVADPSLWTRLDLSDASGVTCRVGDDTVRHAAARANGALEALDVTRADPYDGAFYDAVLEVVAANKGTLRELRVQNLDNDGWRLGQLLTESAAPQLQWHCAVADFLHPGNALKALRNEPPYGTLRLQTLQVHPPEGFGLLNEAFASLLGAALPLHASLRGLSLAYASLQTEAAGDALVDGALAAQLQLFTLHECACCAATGTALARLLRGGSLTELRLSDVVVLVEPVDVAVLADALRDTTSLTALDLRGWTMQAPWMALLGALTGHPHLRKLACRGFRENTEHSRDIGQALGALVAADAPALTELHISFHYLALGLTGFCAALRRNTHLRSLGCVGNFDFGFSPCQHEELLEAVRANTSLRKLKLTDQYFAERPFAEAERLVGERAAADAAAAGGAPVS